MHDSTILKPAQVLDAASNYEIIRHCQHSTEMREKEKDNVFGTSFAYFSIHCHKVYSIICLFFVNLSKIERTIILFPNERNSYNYHF